jgi:hypothetical protein
MPIKTRKRLTYPTKHKNSIGGGKKYNLLRGTSKQKETAYKNGYNTAKSTYCSKPTKLQKQLNQLTLNYNKQQQLLLLKQQNERLICKLNIYQNLAEDAYVNDIQSDYESSEDPEYQPPAHWDDNDLIILFELIQFIPYRFIQRTIDLFNKLSKYFKMPSSGYLNKLCQTKKSTLNKIVIAYQTTRGDFNGDQLTFGHDGSSVNGWKFQTANLIKKRSNKYGFDQLLLFQNKLISSNTASLVDMIQSELDTINKLRNKLSLNDDDDDEDKEDEKHDEDVSMLNNNVKIDVVNDNDVDNDDDMSLILMK